MPPSTRLPRRSPGRRRARQALGAALVVACTAVLGACSNPKPSAEVAPNGLVALVADPGGTRLLGWDASGGDPLAITLPPGGAVWVAAGRAGVLAAALEGGTLATSDPIRLGTKLAWRTVKAVGPTGAAPKGPDYFAAWDTEGGRFATLAGDLVAGSAIRLVLIDPSVRTAFEIPIDRPVVAAPPAWLDGDRLVLVTGDAATPTTTIVDTATSELTDGPIGVRLVATSADGKRIATMAGQGAPVVVRDTAGWLSGDGSSIASVDPPTGSTTAIAFALDSTGQRLVIAWAAKDGTVTLAVHDGGSAWRRVAQPTIGSARAAVVAWRR
jgi:hypothetical protein